jgi:hypothetical protein
VIADVFSWSAFQRASCCRHSNTAATSFAPLPCPAGVVFVANGAGDSRTVSNNLTAAAAQAHAPLQIETVAWSRGYRREVVK